MLRWIAASVGVCLVCCVPVKAESVSDIADSVADWSQSIVQQVRAIRPHEEFRAATAAIRAYTASLTPNATAAADERLGLHLSKPLDESRPLVVLVHGLDMSPGSMAEMAILLRRDGQQVATFGYPADGPIADDANLLREQLTGLAVGRPNLKLDLIAYSMGSLVARDYVEGPGYAGHVDRLILLGPPNHGSEWAHLEPLLKAKFDYDQYRADTAWRPSWMVTEGLCEAAGDLLPHSEFLKELNARPRRAGVRYTIIDGDEHVLRRMASNAIAETAHAVEKHTPQRPATVGIELALSTLAVDVADVHDRSDGAVSLKSAALPGVSDVVTVHADHGTLFWPDAATGAPPAAWPIIRERLSR